VTDARKPLFTLADLERVRKQERERCARLCDDLADSELLNYAATPKDALKLAARKIRKSQ
jgi:hypothetical protein